MYIVIHKRKKQTYNSLEEFIKFVGIQNGRLIYSDDPRAEVYMKYQTVLKELHRRICYLSPINKATTSTNFA